RERLAGGVQRGAELARELRERVAIAVGQVLVVEIDAVVFVRGDQRADRGDVLRAQACVVQQRRDRLRIGAVGGGDGRDQERALAGVGGVVEDERAALAVDRRERGGSGDVPPHRV